MKDKNSLAHSSWNCKYHIVFAPKYRRMEIYGKIRKDIGVIIRRLCEQKGVEIIEAELCPDHFELTDEEMQKMESLNHDEKHDWY